MMCSFRSVKEKYPIEDVRRETGPPSEEMLKSILENAKTGDNLKKILNPHFGMYHLYSLQFLLLFINYSIFISSDNAKHLFFGV